MLNAAKVRVGSQTQLLTATQMQNIRGAFWGSVLNMIGSIMNIIIPGSGVPFQIAAFIISITEGDWVSAISSMVNVSFANLGSMSTFYNNAFGGVIHALGPLGNVLQGIGNAVNGIAQAFSTIFQPVIGFFGGVGNSLAGFLHGTLSLSGTALNVAETAVGIGLNYGISRGLEALGVSPQISGLLGSITAGGIIGGMQPTDTAKNLTQAVNVQKSITTVVTLANVGSLGLQLGIDSGLTNIIGLSLSAIQGIQIQNPTTSLQLAFSKVQNQIASSFAQYGINKLGTSLGLDPRVSTLIGTPVSGALNAGFNAGWANGNAVIAGIQDGILRGATAIGLEYLTQKADLDPLLGSLVSRAVTGAIEGFLHAGDVFGGIFKAFKDSALNIARLGISGTDPWSQAQYLQRVINFSTIVQQRGLAQALEDTATQVLTEDSISSILRSFQTVKAFFQDQIDGNKAQIIQQAGINYKKILLANGDYQIYTADYKDLVEVKMGNKVLRGTFGRDEAGNLGLKTGTVSVLDANGKLQSKTYIENGWNIEDVHYSVDPLSGQEAVQLTVKPIKGKLGITFDEFGNYRDADIEKNDGFRITLQDGLPTDIIGPALSLGSNPFNFLGNSAVLQKLGLTESDLANIELETLYDSATGRTTTRLVSTASDPNAIDRLRAKIGLSSIGDSGDSQLVKQQKFIEVLSNYSNLLGAYTNDELAAHKTAVIDGIKANPNQVYILSAKSDSIISRGIRVATRLDGDMDGVNHSALAFQNPSDGKVYVMEITLGGLNDLKANTNDVRVKTLDEWLGSDKDVLDIQSQMLPMTDIQKLQFGDKFGSRFVNFGTNTPLISYGYDYAGALSEGINGSATQPSDKRICSELVSDILYETIGLQVRSLDNDNYISPNELRRQVDEYIKRMNP